jgi:DUF917 family protein
LKLTKKHVDAAVLGGGLLGGGGGGWIEDGRTMGYLAVELGDPTLEDVDNLAADAVLVTVAAVGAPSSPDKYVKPFHYLRALQILRKNLDQSVSGIITNENGPLATVNGWLQASALGIPVIDAPCNGRAQPTVMMGSMGLHLVPDYVARAAACGGKPHTDNYVELYVEGTVAQVAGMIRQASTAAGGIAAVARNPVAASYAKENGAPGAVRHAIDAGKAMLEAEAQGPGAMIQAAAEALSGEVICRGLVTDVRLTRQGGFDVGSVTVTDGSREYELSFWNEFMTLESSGRRVATFPALIATLSIETGLPLTSAELEVGLSVALLSAGADSLLLGAGMRDPLLYREIEQALNKEIVKYVFSEGN